MKNNLIYVEMVKLLRITSFNHPKVNIKVGHMPLNTYCSLVLQIMYVCVKFNFLKN
jgi:hypothetical protein